MKCVKVETTCITARSRVDEREERSMENIRNKNSKESTYIVSFRKILQEAEKKDRQAMERFRSWFNGQMDPEEEAAYTDAVQQCAGKLRERSSGGSFFSSFHRRGDPRSPADFA